MTVVSATALLVAFWALATRSRSLLRETLTGFVPSLACARFAACALVPLYAIQLAIVAADSRLEGRLTGFAWVRLLPIPVFDDRAPPTTYALLSIATSFAETIALAIVLLTFSRAAGRERRLYWAIACVLAAVSVLAPAMSTTDPYEYVATGILGFHAYAPSSGAFVGTVYEPLQNFVKLTGVIYGPLWLVVDVLQTHLGSSVYQKIEALRITNLGFVALLLWLLRRAGARSAIMLFALNPALWLYTVANPHADIEGLVLLTAAYGYARRSNATATVLLVMAAGLIKLPFVLVGGVMLVPLRGVARRFGLWCGSIVATIVISYLVPGRAYLVEVVHYGGRRAAGDPSYIPALCLAVLIGCALIALALSRRYYFGAAWGFAQIAVVGFPWYLFWGVPYALATGTVEIYLALLPLAAAFLEVNGAFEWTFAELTLVFILAADILLSRRRRVVRSPTVP